MNQKMHKPQNREELDHLIVKIASGKADFNLADIDVSAIDDLSDLLDMERLAMALDINPYHVKQRAMLEKNFDFAGLARWDVSHVTNMSEMFKRCESFTGESLAGWDVSQVTDMNNMFEGCKSFNRREPRRLGCIAGYGHELDVQRVQIFYRREPRRLGCIAGYGYELDVQRL